MGLVSLVSPESRLRMRLDATMALAFSFSCPLGTSLATRDRGEPPGSPSRSAEVPRLCAEKILKIGLNTAKLVSSSGDKVESRRAASWTAWTK